MMTTETSNSDNATGQPAAAARSVTMPSLAEAKALAKHLRADHSARGHAVSHNQSLELLAQARGYRDWNTLHAAIGTRSAKAPEPKGILPGERITGRYLSQPFEGVVRSVDTLRRGWLRLEMDLDTAVDVVTFYSFSNFRKQIKGTVGPDGMSAERTSDGRPHLEVDL